jgi:hypothetical protein
MSIKRPFGQRFRIGWLEVFETLPIGMYEDTCQILMGFWLGAANIRCKKK